MNVTTAPKVMEVEIKKSDGSHEVRSVAGIF
jgi:hypothetical protein